MKAIIWTKYGPPDVLQLGEVDKPTPRDKEVLVKVHAASAFSGDCELRRFHIIPSGWLFLRLYIGIIKPKRITILGQEMSGVIESVGKNVTRFREGDQVFGISGMRMGTYAEYVCISEDTPMVIKPDNMTFEEAAVISAGGFEALHFYQKAKIQKDQKILINGAGGSIGTMALQLAKMSGAEVTCVDSSIKLDMLKALGADDVIDYTTDDFTKNVEAYDIVFDLVGNISFSRTMRTLKKNGVLVLGNSGFITSKLFGIWAAISSNKRAISNLETGTKVDLEYLKNIIASEKIKVVIDKRFPLERTADAHRYIEQGLKKGNVVITVIDDRPDPGNE
jgi:NADPH:quinone reductase-like Zn-dependent oxidoreductase